MHGVYIVERTLMKVRTVNTLRKQRLLAGASAVQITQH